MNLAPGGKNVLLKELEIEVEMFERVVLDRFADVAQRLEFGKPLDRHTSALGEPASHHPQRPLQSRVGEPGARVRLEGAAGGEHILTAERRSAELRRAARRG